MYYKIGACQIAQSLFHKILKQGKGVCLISGYLEHDGGYIWAEINLNLVNGLALGFLFFIFDCFLTAHT